MHLAKTMCEMPWGRGWNIERNVEKQNGGRRSLESLRDLVTSSPSSSPQREAK